MYDMYGKAALGLTSLENWIEKNGYTGYDPYDIKGIPAILKLTDLGNRHYPVAILREICFQLFYTFPVLSRKLLGVKPLANAKAMGLFAASYLDLFSYTKEKGYYDKALFCLNWLKENKASTASGYGWGYPFDWQSTELVPAGTPNGIVTTAAGEAFWKHYTLFHDPDSLNTCKETCKFLVTLPIDNTGEGEFCFSYTPLFKNHVHNLNLFVAEFLIKTGLETGHDDWVQLGNKALQYTLSNQMDNGAFDYNGPPEKPAGHIDHYHTGFVLRMLHSIYGLTGRDDVLQALTICYRHYVSHFFTGDNIPKLMPDRKYRIDIHSCAESIHCLSTLGPLFPEGLKLAENVLGWTMGQLQDKSGYFYYGILKSRFTGIPFKSKIAYIRWGQAWMHRALSSFIISSEKKHT